jgi:hypothetical protein
VTNRNEKQKEELRNLKQENREFKKDLNRKEKALAEMAALLPFKKIECSLQGERERLIPLEVKNKAVILIQEAMDNGASLKASCNTAEISLRTYQRWKKEETKDKRKGAEKYIPGKLSDEKKRNYGCLLQR